MTAKTVEILKDNIRTRDTDTILECITIIGGGQVSEEQRLVRACLIDVYAERTSWDEADALMDLLGM